MRDKPTALDMYFPVSTYMNIVYIVRMRIPRHVTIKALGCLITSFESTDVRLNSLFDHFFSSLPFYSVLNSLSHADVKIKLFLNY